MKIFRQWLMRFLKQNPWSRRRMMMRACLPKEEEEAVVDVEEMAHLACRGWHHLLRWARIRRRRRRPP